MAELSRSDIVAEIKKIHPNQNVTQADIDRVQAEGIGSIRGMFQGIGEQVGGQSLETAQSQGAKANSGIPISPVEKQFDLEHSEPRMMKLLRQAIDLRKAGAGVQARLGGNALDRSTLGDTGDQQYLSRLSPSQAS